MKTQTLWTGILFSAMLAACVPGTPFTTPSSTPSVSPSPSASASTIATVNVDANAKLDPAAIADLEGFKALGCEQENGLKSQNSNTRSQVSFTNGSEGKINVYWLDFNGKRVSYKKNLAVNATHNQSTFVTHPWVITNDQDQCLGIYVPEKAENAKLTIKDSSQGFVDLPTNLTTVTEANITEERALQGVACLKAKGKTTEAAAVQGIINGYNQFKVILGEEAAKQGYLSASVKVLVAEGC